MGSLSTALQVVTWILAGVIGESGNNLAAGHCEEMNRTVRTRTPGGVGGASEQSGARFLFAANRSFTRCCAGPVNKTFG